MSIDFADLLELLRRNTDEGGWLQPLLDDPDSYAVIGGMVTQFARLGPAVDHNGAQATISGASGGQPGTSTITVGRQTSGTTGTIPRGYPFVDPRGVAAVLTMDVPVGAGATTLVLPVATLRATELVNTEDDPMFAVDPSAPAIPGSAGILIAPAGTGGVGATTFQAIGPSTPIAGGAADYLSVHGAERGIDRQTGEDEASYRQRIRNIPDVVSPIAVADSAQQAAQAQGLPPVMVMEPFEDGATSALKTLHGLGSFSALYADDDGLAGGGGGYLDDGFSGLQLVGRREARAYFEVALQDFVSDGAGGIMFVDDGAYLDDPVLGFPFPVPAFPPSVVAALLALQNDVAAKKAAGVNFDIFLRGLDDHTAVGSWAGNVLHQVWTLTPPVGKIWSLQEIDAGFDTNNPGAAILYQIVLDLEGGGTYTSPLLSAPWTSRLPVPAARVTAVHGWLRSNGVALANLVGHVEVLEETL